MNKGGIRVVHPTVRNGLVTVLDPTRKIARPNLCPSCQTHHYFKTYHIVLNDEGAAIVSHAVFEGLKRGGMGGLTVESHVPEPPKQVLGSNGREFKEIRKRPSVALYHE